MKINTQQRVAPVNKRTRVSIDPNPIRIKEVFDIEGNQIDPRTKQIIKRNVN